MSQHPRESEPCPECGNDSFHKAGFVKQIGMTWECDECGTRLFAYDNTDSGMGESFTWHLAEPVIAELGHERVCLDCGYEWKYGGTSNRPTCPNCAGKNTERKDG